MNCLHRIIRNGRDSETKQHPKITFFFIMNQRGNALAGIKCSSFGFIRFTFTHRFCINCVIYMMNVRERCDNVNLIIVDARGDCHMISRWVISHRNNIQDLDDSHFCSMKRYKWNDTAKRIVSLQWNAICWAFICFIYARFGESTSSLNKWKSANNVVGNIRVVRELMNFTD